MARYAIKTNTAAITPKAKAANIIEKMLYLFLNRGLDNIQINAIIEIIQNAATINLNNMLLKRGFRL